MPRTPSQRHNAAVKPLLAQMVTSVGPEPKDLLILAESLIVGLFLLMVRIGGDEAVFEVFVERVRERLAEYRLGPITTKGEA